MTRYLFLSLMIFTTLAANSQSKREKAIRDLYKKGYTYYQQNNDSSAEQIFLQILGSKVKKPYTQYKHIASKLLADIAFRRNDYAQALHYIKTSDKVYPYRHFCGNEMTASHIHLAEMYGKAYVGLKDTTSAIKVLLPEVIETGLASNTNLVTTAVSLLKAKYDKQYLVAQLNSAIDKLEVIQITSQKISYETYSFFFIDVSIPVPDYMMYSEEYKEKSEIEKRKLFLRQSNFYKLVNDK